MRDYACLISAGPKPLRRLAEPCLGSRFRAGHFIPFPGRALGGLFVARHAWRPRGSAALDERTVPALEADQYTRKRRRGGADMPTGRADDWGEHEREYRRSRRPRNGVKASVNSSGSLVAATPGASS